MFQLPLLPVWLYLVLWVCCKRRNSKTQTIRLVCCYSNQMSPLKNCIFRFVVQFQANISGSASFKYSQFEVISTNIPSNNKTFLSDGCQPSVKVRVTAVALAVAVVGDNTPGNHQDVMTDVSLEGNSRQILLSIGNNE